MINVRVKDGFGEPVFQKIFSSGSSFMSSDGIPPFGQERNFNPFVANFLNDAGSSDMRVATPSTFSIGPSTAADRYITTISIALADDNPRLNQFGALAALTNGCILRYTSNGDSIQVLPSLKSNFDFIRMGLGSPSFGSGDTAFQAGTAALTNSEVYMPIIRFSDWMPPFGIRLRKNSRDTLSFQIQDNTTGVDVFNAIAFGFDRFPD